jgi:hypothetical protein
MGLSDKAKNAAQALSGFFADVAGAAMWLLLVSQLGSFVLEEGTFHTGERNGAGRGLRVSPF